MSHIFNLRELDDFSEKINLDELYEKKQQCDMSKLHIFNRLLNRIHSKIKITARQKLDEQFCWFLVPEVMIGVPKYDNAACIAYLFEKLRDNGFYVKYYHPNLLFINWKNWIPGYVRTEIKKKMGVNLDGHGNIVDDKNKEIVQNEENNNNLLLNINKSQINTVENKANYKPIKEYKPAGNFIYNNDILKNIADKFK